MLLRYIIELQYSNRSYEIQYSTIHNRSYEIQYSTIHNRSYEIQYSTIHNRSYYTYILMNFPLIICNIINDDFLPHL